VPLDEESAAALKKAHGEKAKPVPADVQAAIDALKPKEEGAKPLRDAVAQLGLTDAKVGKSGRASDSK
jgi:hypothetical protein